MPLISIIVPAYNQGKYLPDALNSVLAQTLTDWECLVINDGSTDSTEEIMINYLKKDQRFRYIPQPNQGLPGARNTGLREACGSYIQFLDADDLLLPDKLEIQSKEFQQIAPTNAVFCDSIEFWGDAHPRQSAQKIVAFGPFADPLAHFISASTFPIHSFLLRRQVFADLSFDETLNANEDRLFWTHYCLDGGTFSYQPQPLIYRRLRKESMSLNFPQMLKSFLHYFQKLFHLLHTHPQPALDRYEIIALRQCLKYCRSSIRHGMTSLASSYLEISNNYFIDIPWLPPLIDVKEITPDNLNRVEHILAHHDKIAAWQELGFDSDLPALCNMLSKSSEAALLQVYMEELCRHSRQSLDYGFALYGAGQHTRWLLRILGSLSFKPVIIFDDTPVVCNVDEIPVVALSTLPQYLSRISAIIISSDIAHREMLRKLQAIPGTVNLEIINPYQRLQGGPFAKE